jgi:branched-subunit amino acid aminotransferase/4-amino-4-deoxychorismate lyase
MSRAAYVDGQYVPHRSAAVHIEDRGCQFADVAYEMMAVVDLPPVVRIDRDPVGNGRPGPLSRKLRKAYLADAVTAGSAA